MIVGSHEDIIPLKIRVQLSRCDDDNQSQLLDILISCFGASTFLTKYTCLSTLLVSYASIDLIVGYVTKR